MFVIVSGAVEFNRKMLLWTGLFPLLPELPEEGCPAGAGWWELREPPRRCAPSLLGKEGE